MPMSVRDDTIAGFMHMTATKSFLVGAVQRLGAKTVLGDSFAGSDEDAIRAINADPREVFPCGKCDHQDEKGYCLGHNQRQKSS